MPGYIIPGGGEPLGAVPDGVTGLVVRPATATLEFEGGAAPVLAGTNPVWVQQVYREVLRSSGTGATEINELSVYREVLRSLDEVSEGGARKSWSFM